MRGHIRSKGYQSWQLQVYVGTGPDGKPRRHFETVHGRKGDAQRRLTELLSSLDAGTYVSPQKLTVADFLATWLADVAKHNLSPRGFERYAGIIRRHIIPDIGAIPLTQLRLDHLQKHYTTLLDKGLNPKTVRYHHAVIHRALQTAVKRGVVRHNVASGAEMPAIRRADMQTWDPDEVARFLDTAKASPYYALFHTAIYTGMRRSELLALRWQDVDLILCQVYVNRGLHHLKDGSYIFTEPKSARSRRTIALSPAAILVLQAHHEKRTMERGMMGKALSPEDLVFSKPEGEPYRPNTITRAWSTLAKQAGVKVIRFHDARHTHATLLLKAGIHPKVVQERLGHESITMTLDIYSHVAPGLQQAAAERFDEVLNPRHEYAVTDNAR